MDGPTTVQTGRTGWQLTADEQLYMLRLRRGSTTLAELPQHGCAASSGARTTARCGLASSNSGDELQIAVRHGRLPIQISDQSAFEVDAAVEAQAPWVRAVLALLQVNGVEVGGRTQATVRVQGKMQSPSRPCKEEARCRWRRSGSCTRLSLRSMWPTNWLPVACRSPKECWGMRTVGSTYRAAWGCPHALAPLVIKAW